MTVVLTHFDFGFVLRLSVFLLPFGSTFLSRGATDPITELNEGRRSVYESLKESQQRLQLPVPTVTSVVSRAAHSNIIEPGAWLVFRVDEMSSALAHVKTGKKLIPFFDGMPVIDIEAAIRDTSRNEINFFIKPGASSKVVFERLSTGAWFGSTNVSATIGTTDGGPWPTKVTSMGFRRLNLNAISWRLFIGGVALYFVMSLIIAFNSNFLRDSVPQGAPETGIPATFSLSKVQFFLWFSVIFLSFLLVYQLTGDFDTIPESMFGLLGVSAATAVGAAFQDSRKNPLEGMPQDAAPNRLASNRRLKYGWILWDLLSNRDGLNWNRVQMLVVTLVLLAIFGRHVLSTLTIPSFSSDLVRSWE